MQSLLLIHRRYEQICNILRLKGASGRKLRVGFCVVFSSVFPARPLFEQMINDSLFEPFIIIAPDVHRGTEHMLSAYMQSYTELNQAYPGLVRHGYDKRTGRFCNFAPDVDLVCFANPYSGMTRTEFTVEHMLQYSVLPFHVNYTYFGTLQYDRKIMQYPSYSIFWRIFTESILLENLFKTYQLIGGTNTKVTGYCKMDNLACQKNIPRTRKKIIIAPHHTVDETQKTLQLSNFLRYAEFFQELPKRYPQVDFVFRPHPLLLTTLRKDHIWGETRTENYMENLTNNINLQYDSTGEYFELFANSDGMIHDCGSFLAEYLFTDKPVLYLLRSTGCIDKTFDILGLKCLRHCYHGFSSDDIIKFIDNVILLDKDPLCNERVDFVNRHLKINYPNVSKVILDYLKKELT